jgi:hypothetical protein
LTAGIRFNFHPRHDTILPLSAASATAPNTATTRHNDAKLERILIIMLKNEWETEKQGNPELRNDFGFVRREDNRLRRHKRFGAPAG